MTTLEQFKKYLPKEYLDNPDEKLEALLNMFRKMAAICMQIAKKRKQKESENCIEKPDDYNIRRKL